MSESCKNSGLLHALRSEVLSAVWDSARRKSLSNPCSIPRGFLYTKEPHEGSCRSVFCLHKSHAINVEDKPSFGNEAPVFRAQLILLLQG